MAPEEVVESEEVAESVEVVESEDESDTETAPIVTGAGSSTEGNNKEFQLTIKRLAPNGSVVEDELPKQLTVHSNLKVQTLKGMIQIQYGIPIEAMNISFHQKVLDDYYELWAFGIPKVTNPVVHVALTGLKGGVKGVKVEKKKTEKKSERLLLLKAKTQLKVGAVLNTAYNPLKVKAQTMMQTASYIEGEIIKMSAGQLNRVSEAYNESPAMSDRMMKNLASAFVSELTDIESSLKEMSDVRDMLISSFKHAYTSAVFDGSKMTNSSFETMLNTRIEELAKEEES